MTATATSNDNTLQAVVIAVFSRAVALARALVARGRMEDAADLLRATLAAASVRSEDLEAELFRRLAEPRATGNGFASTLGFYENGPYYWEVELGDGSWETVGVDKAYFYWGGEMGPATPEEALGYALAYQACWPEAEVRIVLASEGNGKSDVPRRPLLTLAGEEVRS